MIELMRELHDIFPSDWEVVAGRNSNSLLADERENPWYVSHVVADAPLPQGRSPLTALRNEQLLRSHASRFGRIVHRTYHPVLDLLPRSAIVVETVHDLWDFVAEDEHGPVAALRRHLKRRALARADRIICVSQSTRNYLGNLWPQLADRAVVIPHGTRRLSARPAAIHHDRPFFLFVGRRERYKNFGVLLEALSQMSSGADLICFGGGGFSSDEQQQIVRRSLESRVHQVAGDDHALAGHYEAAQALLYPSRHEGFGLPLLEAMSHDCPVIASPLTSLPEVGGAAALYADASDANAWTSAMQLMFDDDAARGRAIAAGRLRAAQFTWPETARRHAALYQEMLG